MFYFFHSLSQSLSPVDQVDLQLASCYFKLCAFSNSFSSSTLMTFSKHAYCSHWSSNLPVFNMLSSLDISAEYKIVVSLIQTDRSILVKDYISHLERDPQLHLFLNGVLSTLKKKESGHLTSQSNVKLSPSTWL